MSPSRVVVVTGASSGMGRAIARALATGGFAVYGTSRDPSRARPIGGVEMLRLDVRVDESASACLETVLEQAGRLDVLEPLLERIVRRRLRLDAPSPSQQQAGRAAQHS